MAEHFLILRSGVNNTICIPTSQIQQMRVVPDRRHSFAVVIDYLPDKYYHLESKFLLTKEQANTIIYYLAESLAENAVTDIYTICDKVFTGEFYQNKHLGITKQLNTNVVDENEYFVPPAGYYY